MMEVYDIECPCPFCGHDHSSCSAHREDVKFCVMKSGKEHEASVSVLQPLYTCVNCKKQWYDYTSEILREKAVEEARALEELLLKPCPCCGLHQSANPGDLIDSLHPTNIFYASDPELDGALRFWRGYDEDKPSLEAEGQIWEYSCRETIGGCGLTITGHGREETILKWNRRK